MTGKFLDATPVLAKNFRDDFSQLIAGLHEDYEGPPYAFTRYGDGEAAIIFRDSRHAAKSDGWNFPGGATQLGSDLLEAISIDDPCWLIGHSSEPHHSKWHKRLAALAAHRPPECVTFAEVFMFGNYSRFVRAWRAKSTKPYTVCSMRRILPDPFDARWPAMRKMIVGQWLELPPGQPILVAAGPQACVLIADYWRATANAPDRRAILLDVGSVLDVELYGRRTRKYQNTRNRLHAWEPTWKKG